MSFPLSSGQVARLLGLREPQLNEYIRRGRIRNPPCVVAGRRLWFEQHLRDTACDLEIADRLGGSGSAEDVATQGLRVDAVGGADGRKLESNP